MFTISCIQSFQNQSFITQNTVLESQLLVSARKQGAETVLAIQGTDQTSRTTIGREYEQMIHEKRNKPKCSDAAM